ncbi:MAG: VanZ family protein [Acidobacteriota bacterium]
MSEDIKIGHNWRERLIRYAPLFLWTMIVLGFSSTQASSEQTSRIFLPLLKFLFPSAPIETIEIYHAVIRKLAHLSEYGILGFLSFRAFARSSVQALKKYSFVASILSVLMVACIDEYHQSFEPTRTSSPWDVAIDMAGGIAGVGLLWLWMRVRKRNDPNPIASGP